VWVSSFRTLQPPIKVRRSDVNGGTKRLTLNAVNLYLYMSYLPAYATFSEPKAQEEPAYLRNLGKSENLQIHSNSIPHVHNDITSYDDSFIPKRASRNLDSPSSTPPPERQSTNMDGWYKNWIVEFEDDLEEPEEAEEKEKEKKKQREDSVTCLVSYKHTVKTGKILPKTLPHSSFV